MQRAKCQCYQNPHNRLTTANLNWNPLKNPASIKTFIHTQTYLTNQIHIHARLRSPYKVESFFVHTKWFAFGRWWWWYLKSSSWCRNWWTGVKNNNDDDEFLLYFGGAGEWMDEWVVVREWVLRGRSTTLSRPMHELTLLFQPKQRSFLPSFLNRLPLPFVINFFCHFLHFLSISTTTILHPRAYKSRSLNTLRIEKMRRVWFCFVSFRGCRTRRKFSLLFQQ